MSGSVKLGSIEKRYPDTCTCQIEISRQPELFDIRIIDKTKDILEVSFVSTDVGDQVVAINGTIEIFRDIKGFGCLACTAQPVVKLIAINPVRGDCGIKSSSLAISNLYNRRCHVVETVRDGATIVVSHQTSDIVSAPCNVSGSV